MSLDFHQKVEQYKKEMMKQYKRSRNAPSSDEGIPTVAEVRAEKPVSAEVKAEIPVSAKAQREESVLNDEFSNAFPTRGNLDMFREDETRSFSETKVEQLSSSAEQSKGVALGKRPKNKESFSAVEPLAYQDEQREEYGVAQKVMANLGERAVPTNAAENNGEAANPDPNQSNQESVQNPSQEPTGNSILDAYLIENPKRGYLKIEVSSAFGALPVEGAVGTVSKVMSDGQRYIIDTLTTDRSGISEVIALPAPDKELSESPGKPGAAIPYAEYDLEVKKEGFVPVVAKNVPIFDGILSLQPVSMKPLLDSEETAQPDEILESQPNL